MALNIAGVVVMAVFYVVVLGTGVWASFKAKRVARKSSANQLDMILLGNRSISLLVGMCTTTAMWIGGGYLLVVAEISYNPSGGIPEVVSTATAYITSFIICGTVFSKPMRERKFVTMLDPFKVKYGKGVACFLSILSLIADMIWVPPSFIALGAVTSVIIELPFMISIWISAAIAIIYTLMGGLYSVAYTDVIQLIFMFFATWLCVPFLWMSPAVSGALNTTLPVNTTSVPSWLQARDLYSVLEKVETFIILVFGSLAYQPIHQRLLSSSSAFTAKMGFFAAVGGVVVFTIPSAVLGHVAITADWNQTSYGSISPLEAGEVKLIFPIAMKCLLPSYIAIIGISAVAAAVMSSTDSCLISSATTFSSVIYQSIRPKASHREMHWVIRAVVVVVGLIGTSLTSWQSGCLEMWYFGLGLTYVFMFPQLICVLFFEPSNVYGCVMGFTVGLLLRLLCGWPSLAIPASLHLPGGSYVDGVYVQRFPVRTLCMLCSMASILTFSYLSALLFDKGMIPEAWDVLSFLKMPRKLPPMDSSSGDKNPSLKEKDPLQDPSETMMNSAC